MDSIEKSKIIKIFIPFSSTLNTGDAGILISTLNSIQREFGQHAEVLVGSHQANTAKKHYKQVNYMKYADNLNDWIFSRGLTRIPRDYFILFYRKLTGSIPVIFLTGYEKQMIREIKKSNLVLAPGGGYLTDVYFLQFNLALFSWIIKKQKKNLVFYSQSIGPFWKKQTLKHLKFILQKSNSVILRDFESAEHLKKLFPALPQNIHITADEAFTYRNPESSARKTFNHIGISVRDWNFADLQLPHQETMARFKEHMARLCEDLIKQHNCQITFLSTCQGNVEYKDDSLVALDIYNLIDEQVRRKVYVDRNFYPLNELIEQYKKFDVFIGTRMHSIIFNFLNLTPCLGIVYEFKTRELFRRIGLGELLIDMHSDDYSHFYEKAHKLIEDKESYAKKLEKEIPQLRDLALNNVKLVYRSIRN